ncbi:hypothetical protein K435DRAFT_795743 [Dendrothele bispora CBS 962.96]|uniref:GH16 domain-containing protein n=1 Tax=Dendrothele bispora (strain CBS 962.96) TaxID=1314807 RepID=A0A4S8M7Q2_DENBC|nr:hypothetical protein K435DRAFT_795743 [Dendrothele bispora CBS 962.96]
MFTRFHDLPFSVLALLLLQTYHVVAASIDYPSFGDFLSSSSSSPQFKTRDDPAHDRNPNGSFFIWLPEDEYSEDTFLDYVNKLFALDNGLAYVQDAAVFMKGDDTTCVRISIISQYNIRPFILDINHAPWGCVIWPARWTVGGVQSNSQNNTNCDGTIPLNAGCGVQKWSRASYREDFNLQGGGVFAMKWDTRTGSLFGPSSALPFQRISSAVLPTLTQWGPPVAALEPWRLVIR